MSQTVPLERLEPLTFRSKEHFMKLIGTALCFGFMYVTPGGVHSRKTNLLPGGKLSGDYGIWLILAIPLLLLVALIVTFASLTYTLQH